MLRLAGLLVVLSSLAVAERRPQPAPVGNDRVGVTSRVFHPAAMRNWRGAQAKELQVLVWYPANSAAHETRQMVGPPGGELFEEGMAAPEAAFEPMLGKMPLVVLSHGTGGSAEQMAWLGIAFARAGYMAVAVNHPGNNSHEELTAEGFALWWERATDLSEVIDGVLADPDLGSRVDARAIGAVGFSIGGYTVMELAGAQTDISVLYDRCRKNADLAACHVPEMKKLQAANGNDPSAMLMQVRKTSGESMARAANSFRDPRVKAVFAIAPAVAFTLTAESLRAIRVPIEMAVGDADRIAPAEDNADWIRENNRGARENVLPGGVAHYTFLDTCTAVGKAQLGVYCSDAPGVDREKVHAQVAAEAVKFMDRGLKVR